MCESKRRFPNLGRRWPFFRYPGSKWRLMPRFIELFPPQHDHYVSVFGGSAADILAKPPARIETFNDLDDHIYTLFAVVRDERRAGRLRELLAVTPRHMRVYREALEILARRIADPIETAWAFLVVAHQGLCISHPSLQGPSQFAVMRKPGTDRRCPSGSPTSSGGSAGSRSRSWTGGRSSGGATRRPPSSSWTRPTTRTRSSGSSTAGRCRRRNTGRCWPRSARSRDTPCSAATTIPSIGSTSSAGGGRSSGSGPRCPRRSRGRPGRRSCG